VETLVNGGAGLARYEGRVVFIPHTAVGDVVRCRVTKVKKNFLEAEILDIINPAPQRRQPECPVAGDCGGCQWQHLPYPEQLVWKESLFRESLVRQCGVAADKILSILPAADQWSYRSRVQIKSSNTATGFVTGFYRPKSHSVVPVEQCPVIAAELNSLLGRLQRLLNHSSYADSISQLDLSVDDRRDCSVVVHYSGQQVSSLADLLLKEQLGANLFIRAGAEKQLINIQAKGALRLTVDHPPLELAYGTGSFSQINLEQNRVLVDTVVSLAELTGAECVLDLYCGMGNFSLPLSRRARHVVGVEESVTSIVTARENSRLNGIDNVEFFNRSAEGALATFSPQSPIDLLLLDPPRSGALAIMDELLKFPVKRVIYVSCDPQTLARDLKILVTGGYDLISSQPLDMFPQTHHCESITLLHYS
jgi:23S rRNA (uracil1939-C5)-methyltransferase